MSVEEKKLRINDRGVFAVRTRQVSPKAILHHRARLQSKILEAREQIVFWQKELKSLETELGEYNSPVVSNYMAQMEAMKDKAERRAQELLREFVGEIAYKQIQKKGSVAFTAKDGLKYRVNGKGHVFRGDRRLCIIRPSQLPLPDFVIAALVNVREQPNRFRFRR